MYLLEKTQACPEDSAAFEQGWYFSEDVNGTILKATTVTPVLKVIFLKGMSSRYQRAQFGKCCCIQLRCATAVAVLGTGSHPWQYWLTSSLALCSHFGWRMCCSCTIWTEFNLVCMREGSLAFISVLERIFFFCFVTIFWMISFCVIS